MVWLIVHVIFDQGHGKMDKFVLGIVQGDGVRLSPCREPLVVFVVYTSPDDCMHGRLRDVRLEHGA